MSPRRRILRVISRLNVGGPARQVLWLARDLREMGWDTTVVAGTIPRNEDSLEAEFADAGVDIVRFPQMEREIDPLRDVQAAWKMRRLVADSGADLVHAHLSKAAFLVRLARWMSPGTPFPPVVYTHHGNRFRGYFSPWKEFLVRATERALAPCTEAILVLSPQQKREIAVDLAIGKEAQYRVVPLGLDLSFVKRLPDGKGMLRSELGVAPARPLVGIIGRVAPIKDHATFIDAAAGLLRSLPAEAARPFFVIVGDGSKEEMDALRSRVESHGIGADVRFLGTRRDPARFLADLDVVTLTSRNEGTPLSLIEAMAAGIPIVATNVGGVEDLLTREWTTDPNRDWEVSAIPRGVVVPAGRPAEFAAALGVLLADLARRDAMGRASQEFAMRNLSVARLASDLDRLYRQILSARESPPGA